MREKRVPYTANGATIFLERYGNSIGVCLNEKDGYSVGYINYKNGKEAGLVPLGRIVEDPEVALTLSIFTSRLNQR